MVIILEHESSPVYKKISKPQIDLRVFAEIYATKTNVKFVMADTLLRFETLARRDIDSLQSTHPLSFRLDFDGEIEIINPNSNTNKKFTVLPEKTMQEIEESLSHKKNVFVFSLRKGLATMTVCKDCGEMLACPTCGAPVVLYESRSGKKRILGCNKCKIGLDADTHCKNCGSWNLLPLGVGTDTVVEHFKKYKNKLKLFKLDRETAGSSRGAQQIIKDFEEALGAVLVSTEMGFLYMKNKVPLSIISSFVFCLSVAFASGELL